MPLTVAQEEGESAPIAPKEKKIGPAQVTRTGQQRKVLESPFSPRTSAKPKAGKWSPLTSCDQKGEGGPYLMLQQKKKKKNSC